MACGRCGYKGYNETFVMRDAKTRPMITQCRFCKDVSAYSRRVQEIINGPREPAPVPVNADPSKVIPFP